MDTPEWQWDEMKQVGTDYASLAEVEAYDRRMAEMRDVAAENQAILQALALPPQSAILEIGTGTGAFAREAARVGHSVTALDISSIMLQYAARRADQEGLKGIRFAQAGFLTHQSPPQAVDAVVSGLALHHLPDLWKAVALERIYGWLRPGGQFYLHDVVFDWGRESYQRYFDRLTDTGIPESSRRPFIRHIRQEYSTVSWIMELLIRHAGFDILSISGDGFLRSYRCRK